MPRYSNMLPGDPAPGFKCATRANPRFTFDTTAGRWLILGFIGTGNRPQTAAMMAALRDASAPFDDLHACLFMVTNDDADRDGPHLPDRTPGIRTFFDADQAVSRTYGATPLDAADTTPASHRAIWVVIDPTLRVESVHPMTGPDLGAAALATHVASLPAPALYAGFPVQAPILVLPRVFEPQICTQLIDIYEEQGGQDSGFMREIDGVTQAVQDRNHKVRKDVTLSDPELMKLLQGRIKRRVIPEIAKVHQFHVTRMERYIVSCYAAEDEAHFNAHRDNTTSGTAHRRFAVSINLNDAFEGGEVSFPEYGPRSFKAPPGGAVVFSCSLLHKVSKVTAGRRYAFLPFLYDDAAAAIREANNAKLGEGVGAYTPQAKTPK